MATVVPNAQEAELFATRTNTRSCRVRALAAAIVREYNAGTAADKVNINAIVDELLVLTP